MSAQGPLCHHHPESLLPCRSGFLSLLLAGHQDVEYVPYCHTESSSGYVLITREKTEAKCEREGPRMEFRGALPEPAFGAPEHTVHHTQDCSSSPAVSSETLTSVDVLPKPGKAP